MRLSPILFACLLPLTASLPACAAGTKSAKTRLPASDDPIPKCWKIYNPALIDGYYKITIPANDTITAKDVQAMIMTLQAFGVASHTVSAYGSESINLEAQFVTLSEAKNLGYGTQDKLEDLVSFVLKGDLPYLAKGVTITCFEDHPLRHH
ncbi:MAG: hypothetical protein ACXVB9_22345 [Bdellovibrionota bacterium]